MESFFVTKYELFLRAIRIKIYAHLTLELTFPALVKQLLERLTLLSYFHCGGTLDRDFTSLLEKSQHIEINNGTN